MKHLRSTIPAAILLTALLALAGCGGEGETTAAAKATVGAEPGQLAPDFELTSTTGEMVKLSDYRGKVVVLDFWATWCPPCKKAMPHLQEIHEEFASEDVVVLGVSVDANSEKVVQPFVDKHGYSFTMLLNGQRIAPDYKVSGIPATFILDPDGKVRGSFVGYRQKADYVRVIEQIREGA